MNELSTEEKHSLVSCEKVIERGVSTFQETGIALMQVRDQKLYRVGYESFDDYLDKRWGLTNSRARQFIAAAKTVASVEISTKLNECQAKELARVPKDKQQEVIDWAIEKAEGKPLTAAKIKQAASEVLEAEPDTEDAPYEEYQDTQEIDERLDAAYDDEPENDTEEEEEKMGIEVRHESVKFDRFTSTVVPFLIREIKAAESEVVFLARLENFIAQYRSPRE